MLWRGHTSEQLPSLARGGPTGKLRRVFGARRRRVEADTLLVAESHGPQPAGHGRVVCISLCRTSTLVEIPARAGQEPAASPRDTLTRATLPAAPPPALRHLES